MPTHDKGCAVTAHRDPAFTLGLVRCSAEEGQGQQEATAHTLRVGTCLLNGKQTHLWERRVQCGFKGPVSLFILTVNPLGCWEKWPNGNLTVLWKVGWTAFCWGKHVKKRFVKEDAGVKG